MLLNFLFIGYWLLGYGLLVIGYWLWVIGYWLWVIKNDHFNNNFNNFFQQLFRWENVRRAIVIVVDNTTSF